eukprot:TRINITY_DN11216_c0_g1_i2.p1 TRINITY_DN11216_c0_g1~~TRINITY_DN11216_c0_g1_i2.p1  ORF type:complete len:149 (+),score=32.36 TRINITY_DN11216_c0_g1_i2:233-679(+)
MGACGSDDHKERKPPQPAAPVQTQADLITLNLTSPVKRSFKIDSNETVRALCAMVATDIGLDVLDGEYLEVEFGGERITDKNRSLASLGFCEDASFEVSKEMLKGRTSPLVEMARACKQHSHAVLEGSLMNEYGTTLGCPDCSTDPDD